MAEPTFDPRFDPAFQRGYEPSVERPAVPVAAARPRVQAEQIGGPPAAGANSEQSEASKGVSDAEGFGPIRRGVNPYVVLLWVLGVVFTVGGAALLFASYLLMSTSYSAGPAQDSVIQALYVFGSVFGVPLVTVGLATISGLIFLSAWRSWRRHNGSSS